MLFRAGRYLMLYLEIQASASLKCHTIICIIRPAQFLVLKTRLFAHASQFHLIDLSTNGSQETWLCMMLSTEHDFF